MKKSTWAILFFFLLAINLVGVNADVQAIRFITKPALLIVLIAYLLQQTKSVQTPLKKWPLLALAFSWLGDVLLLFEAKAPMFFILGLVAFLIAHVCYIILFNRIRTAEKINQQLFLVLLVVVYYVGLISLLLPHLGAMQWPVVVYGLVISCMLLLALHLKKISINNVGWLLMLGAIFFVASDSILAFNKFYQPFSTAGLLIMLTYGLAQWLITEGSIRWLTEHQTKVRHQTFSKPF